MKEIFEMLLSVTFSTNVFILAILLIRFLFKGSSKNSRMFLWLLVGIKLVLPFNIKSRFSLIPHSISQTTSDLGSVATNVVSESAGEIQKVVSTETLFYVIWAVGALAILVYGVVSFWRLHKNIGDAIKAEGNVYQSEKVISPFVLGVLRPKIYIPFNLDDETLSHIVSHEKSHVKNFDNITKLVAFGLMAIHWFNPLVWVCFKLVSKDIELACDERVVKNYTVEKRKSYAEALLNCAVNEGKGLIYPVAFGEVSVKDRIKSVVAYKKTVKAIIALTLLVAVVAFACFATVPRVTAKSEPKPSVAEETTAAATVTKTTEPLTEVTTEPVTEQTTEQYNEDYEAQPQFDLNDIDPENREIFSIAMEEGKHVAEIQLRQDIQNGVYDLDYNDYPTRVPETYPAVVTPPDVIEIIPDMHVGKTGGYPTQPSDVGPQRIPGLTAYSWDSNGIR